MTERTKGPWHTGGIFDPGTANAHQNIWGPTPEGKQSGEIIASNILLGDAAAIVKWENHFDELVQALEQALRQWSMYADMCERDDRTTLETEKTPEGEMFRSAKALLEKAKS
jgi:hypothetical protein